MTDTLVLQRNDFAEVAFPAHVSHKLVVTHNTECENCWGCSCHSPDILMQPCDNSVEIEANHPEIVASVTLQAARYGAQMRQLEDVGWHADASAIKLAWTAFQAQLIGSYFRRVARVSYHNVYDR